MEAQQMQLDWDSPTVKAYRVAAENTLAAWDVVRPFLEKALEHNREGFGEEDVKFLCANDHMQLWVAVTSNDQVLGAAVTEIRTFPRMKVVNIVLLGGDNFESWKHLHTEIEDWALMQEARKIQAFCRKGMAYKAEPMGFIQDYVVISKDLMGRLQ